MLANHPDKRSLYKQALPCFPKCLLRSKILLSISAPRPFSASVPLPCDRRPPQTATGRRRAAQTALWGPDAPKRPQDAGERPRRLSGGQMPPNGHRTPESGPDGSLGPDAPKRPQDAGDRPRRPQDAGERPRRPQDAGERPRRPQDAGERPRRPQDAGERPRRPQDAGDRPYSQQDPNLSSWTRLEGVDPPWNPPFFI